MLNINPVSSNIVNFKQKNSPSAEYPIMYKTYKTEATTGKKWGVGIASWLIPGSGQAINNEWGKGIGFFALSVIAPAVVSMIAGVSMLSTLKQNTKAATTASIIALSTAWLTSIGGRIWACVDAVKNAKSEIDIPIQQK